MAAYEHSRAWEVFRSRLGSQEPSERLFQQLLRTLRPETRGALDVLGDPDVAEEFATEIEGLAPQVFEDLLWGGAARMLRERTGTEQEDTA